MERQVEGAEEGASREGRPGHLPLQEPCQSSEQGLPAAKLERQAAVCILTDVKLHTMSVALTSPPLNRGQLWVGMGKGWTG